MIQDWYWATYNAIQDLWVGFLYFIPNFVGAVIVFVVGWFVASWVGIAVTQVLNWLRLNQIFAKGKWDEALEKARIKADVAGFIGQVCRWILVITFLSASVEVLGLVTFAALLTKIVAWLPNVIVAVLMMVVAVIVADILEKVVVASLVKAKMKRTHLVSLAVKWSIYIFSLFAILMQLDVASLLVQTLFTGIVAILVIAGGLALGLGAKDVVKDLLEDLVRKLRD